VHDTPSTNTNPGINWLADASSADPTTGNPNCRRAKQKLKAARKKARKAKAALKKARKKGAPRARVKRLKKQVNKANKNLKKAKRKKRAAC